MAMSDRTAAVTVGALILVLAAASCGGDGATDSSQSGNPAADQTEPAPDASQSADGATPTPAPLDSDAEVTIDLSTLILAWVEVQVRGIGGGGSYIYYPVPEIRQQQEELLEEILAEGDDYFVVRPVEGEPEVTIVDDGGCLLVQPLSVVFASDGVGLVNENMIFQANVRYSQGEYVSLANNGSNTHGGFAKGGVRRDESKQWDIYGDGPLLYKVQAPAELGYVVVGARWAGKSVENFSGEEADGIVEVACFFVAPGR